jgi:hypothetical protein
MAKRFEQMYGAKGDWVRFFTQDEAYMRTELIHHLKRRESKAERTYVTLDFWASQNAYDDFRRQHFAKYKAIDQECQEMTESEREIGRFVRILNE